MNFLLPIHKDYISLVQDLQNILISLEEERVEIFLNLHIGVLECFRGIILIPTDKDIDSIDLIKIEEYLNFHKIKYDIKISRQEYKFDFILD